MQECSFFSFRNIEIQQKCWAPVNLFEKNGRKLPGNGSNLAHVLCWCYGYFLSSSYIAVLCFSLLLLWLVIKTANTGRYYSPNTSKPNRGLSLFAVMILKVITGANESGEQVHSVALLKTLQLHKENPVQLMGPEKRSLSSLLLIYTCSPFQQSRSH